MKALHEKLAKAKDRDYDRRTIEDWVLILYNIYKRHNRTCGPYELWLQVVNDASQLGETIRREIIRTTFPNQLSVYTQIARLFCRISAFIGRYIYDTDSLGNTDSIRELMLDSPLNDFIGGDERYEKWILLKYPSACPTCGNNPCICASYRKIMEDRKNKQYKEFWGKHKDEYRVKVSRYKQNADGSPNELTLEKYDQNLEDWVIMFGKLYASSHIDISLESIGFHFLEEVGEVSDGLLCLNELNKLRHKYGVYKQTAINLCDVVSNMIGHDSRFSDFQREYSDYCKEQGGRVSHLRLLKYLMAVNMTIVKEELADVFSWMCAILNKIDTMTMNWAPNIKPRKISEALHQRYTLSADELGCSYCASAECKSDCIIRSTARKSKDARIKILKHELFGVVKSATHNG